MSKKFIPNGDRDFSDMAYAFASAIAREPKRFLVSQEDSDALTLAVKKYREALDFARRGQKSAVNTRAKEVARLEAETHIRRIAHIVRATKSIDSVSRAMLGLGERTRKTKSTHCPKEAPKLKFIEAKHQAFAAPIHELQFYSMDNKPRPAGATRLELFVALVPPEQKVGGNVIENLNARPWYLRSYTRSPIRLTPPIANVPMRVVYWARWADSVGNVGPFSAPAVGWVEGGSHLPALPNIPRNLGITEPDERINIDRTPFNDEQERIYWVAIGTAQIASLNPTGQVLMLEEESEKKMLEGPESQAA